MIWRINTEHTCEIFSLWQVGSESKIEEMASDQRGSSLMMSVKHRTAEGGIKCVNTKWEIISSASTRGNFLVCVAVHKLSMAQQCDYAAKIANSNWSSANRNVVCGTQGIV